MPFNEALATPAKGAIALDVESTCRHTGAMESKQQKSAKKPRQIVGISLTPELASKVKAEAGRRNIALKKLFEEMWEIYEKQSRKAAR